MRLFQDKFSIYKKAGEPLYKTPKSVQECIELLKIAPDGISTLLDYEKEDYFKENQTIYFTDVYGSATAYQVMAVVKYTIDDMEEWDLRIRNHADMESYNAWMEQLQGRALYYAEPEHAPTSIITLATCDRRIYGKNGRFLVIAGKVTG